MRILLANPNTTAAVTDLVAARAREIASPGTEIVPATAAFGAAIIGSRAELAVAEHAALDLIARAAGGCDAVIVAASTDSGTRAAREVLGVPVVGLTEAALHTACLIGGPFATITLSARSNATLREQIAASGLASRCLASRAVPATPQELLADPDRVAAALSEAAVALVAEGADVVVLIGAVMAGIAARLAGELPVPVLEGVSCAVALAEALVRLRLPKARVGGYAAPVARETAGLHPALASLLKGPP